MWGWLIFLIVKFFFLANKKFYSQKAVTKIEGKTVAQYSCATKEICEDTPPAGFSIYCCSSDNCNADVSSCYVGTAVGSEKSVEKQSCPANFNYACSVGSYF